MKNRLNRFRIRNAGKYWAVIDSATGLQVGFDIYYSGAKALARELERESLADLV